MSQPTTAPLVIRLFGPFAAWVSGEPLRRLRTRKGEWLLALLALRQGGEVERDWLAGTLWPESFEEQALLSLRKSLQDLRQALGSEAYRLRAPTRRTLCLELADAEVDVLAFDAAVARGDARSLEEAVALYRGPLLEECAEEWVFAERQAREEAYLAALETLAAGAASREDHTAAEQYLRRAVAVNPLRESSQRALMQALAAGGNFAAAVQTYRELRLLLHRELNTEPDPETTALFERIRDEAREGGRGRGGEGARGRTDDAISAGTVPPSRPLAPSPPPPLIPRRGIPRPLTRLIGREEDVAKVAVLLAGSRLVTLTGTGGVGKTRLAIQAAEQVAEEYPDGVGFVDLAPLASPALVPKAVAVALGVKEEPGCPLVETLQEFLRPKQLLLVLDNCEHLVEACAHLVETLLLQCSRLRILVTGRQTLGLTGERAWRVPSLSLPEPGVQVFRCSGVQVLTTQHPALSTQQPTPAHLSTRTPEHLLLSAAVRLFVERARDARPEFALTEGNAAAVAQICRRLDGIPLAIELAAARLKLLTPEQIAARVDDRFRLLTEGSRTALPRHQTLQATMDWSYDLLLEAERVLLRRLSVFAGGWTLEAAEAVCTECGMRNAECGVPPTTDPSSAALRPPPSAFRTVDVLALLSRLVDKSMVLAADGEEEVRYRLLETVRQYARERLLERGEEASVRERHGRHYLTLAEAAEGELEGPRQGRWLEWLEREHDNLRAALAWSQEQDDDGETLLRLAGALWPFWHVRGHESEGREWLCRALAAGAHAAPAARAKALTGAGALAVAQGEYPGARALLEEGLAIQRARKDRRGIAAALNFLARIATYQDDYARAQALYGEELAVGRAMGNRVWEANALNSLGMVLGIQGEYAAARSRVEESLAIRRELGDRRGIAGALNLLGELALIQGDYRAAQARLEEALALNHALGDRKSEAINLVNLGEAALFQGDWATAEAHCEEGLEILRELGVRRVVARAQSDLGDAAVLRGDGASGRARYEEALAIDRQIGNRRRTASNLNKLGEVALLQGDYPAARALCAESLAIRRALDDRRGIAESLEVSAWMASLQGDPARAARLHGAAERLREALGAPLPPARRKLHATRAAAAREALGESAFAVAHAEGRAMTLAEAIAFALEG